MEFKVVQKEIKLQSRGRMLTSLITPDVRKIAGVR